MRFLDALIGMATRSSVKKGKFMEINDATIHYHKEKTENFTASTMLFLFC
jgi:hypothetical protein